MSIFLIKKIVFSMIWREFGGTESRLALKNYKEIVSHTFEWVTDREATITDKPITTQPLWNESNHRAQLIYIYTKDFEVLTV